MFPCYNMFSTVEFHQKVTINMVTKLRTLIHKEQCCYVKQPLDHISEHTNEKNAFPLPFSVLLCYPVRLQGASHPCLISFSYNAILKSPRYSSLKDK